MKNCHVHFQLCSKFSPASWTGFPWILKKELASLETVNPPWTDGQMHFAASVDPQLCSQLVRHDPVLIQKHQDHVSDHQVRANIFCSSAEFVTLAWIQPQFCKFCFLEVQQSELVSVSGHILICRTMMHFTLVT